MVLAIVNMIIIVIVIVAVMIIVVVITVVNSGFPASWKVLEIGLISRKVLESTGIVVQLNQHTFYVWNTMCK